MYYNALAGRGGVRVDDQQIKELMERIDQLIKALKDQGKFNYVNIEHADIQGPLVDKLDYNFDKLDVKEVSGALNLGTTFGVKVAEKKKKSGSDTSGSSSKKSKQESEMTSTSPKTQPQSQTQSSGGTSPKPQPQSHSQGTRDTSPKTQPHPHSQSSGSASPKPQPHSHSKSSGNASPKPQQLTQSQSSNGPSRKHSKRIITSGDSKTQDPQKKSVTVQKTMPPVTQGSNQQEQPEQNNNDTGRVKLTFRRRDFDGNKKDTKDHEQSMNQNVETEKEPTYKSKRKSEATQKAKANISPAQEEPKTQEEPQSIMADSLELPKEPNPNQPLASTKKGFTVKLR